MKHTLKLSSILLALFVIVAGLRAAPEGTLPLGKDGKPLNLDFEDGTLKDWTATGTAFEKQPVHGDTVTPRRSDMHSAHQGEYWIGTYEFEGDAPQGTLTSAPFKVTAPYAAFLVAGGHFADTCVELVRADTQEVFFTASGYDNETLRPVVVDLKAQQGKNIFIRLVDNESGGWGHINFDDFRFYAEKPEFPNALDPVATAKASEMPPQDVIKFAGLSPEQAPKEMTVPPGFKVTLFAGEPDVMQPIAFCIDDRGRIWVAEAYTYPKRAPEGQGKDRIICFEDTNGDGKFDKRTVFYEGLNLVSGLQVGFGGVWVGAAPYLMFIPMQDGDTPKASGPPQILLDGWGYQDTHETLNTFTWGPDGWLYGCHGVFTLSKVGKPGTPDNERTIVTAGIWRYHPTKHTFEYFAEGTSNPWGVDFDEHGQAFIEACVIPHLWHMIQGGRYMRQGGQHVNPYIFDDIKTIADHLHYAGNQGPHAANGRSDSMGGGHAHAGLMIYQGGAWPEKYNGQLFMNNVHGVRMNMDIPEREGSGFVGHHGKDFILYNDAWAQMLNMHIDQNGSMFMIDWYDKNRCHSTDTNATDRSNGRIYKVVYNDTPWTPVDLQKKSDDELADYLSNTNIFYIRHAERILEERYTAGQKPAELVNRLWKGVLDTSADAPNPIVKLRYLWTLHCIGGDLEGKKWLPLLAHDAGSPYADASYEYVRAWMIQFLFEDKNPEPYVLTALDQLAKDDTSPVVRLYIASALQRIPAAQRWDIMEALDQHGEDANDHNLPYMYWFAAEPLPTLDMTRALKMAEASKIPRMLEFTARRVAAIGGAEALAAVAESLNRVSDDAAHVKSVLNGLTDALRGQRHVAMPAGWEGVEEKLDNSGDSEIRAQTQALSLVFGSANALNALRKTLMDEKADSGARHTALDSLLSVRDANLSPLLLELLSNPDLQGPALRGLAAYDNPKTPEAILAIYPSLDAARKRDALNTLASRVSFAKPLLAAVAQGSVPVKEMSADLVRQLRGLKNADVEQQILKLWGVSRDSSADMKAQIEKYKRIFWAGGSVPGNASRGRLVFSRTCQQCHTLFGTGGHVGPDLTGSQRADLNYIVLNVVDPNAVIPNDYRASIIETKDDRSITGIVTKQDDNALTVVTANETLVIPRNEVVSQQLSPMSMMPEGLLQPLSDQEVRDLFYYLSRPGQVPLPTVSEIPADAATFFNGKDLSAWDGDTNLWSVQNGEIVGKTTVGLKHNEFLKSRMDLGNFRLVLQLKLTPDKENSGVQFHSERFGDYEMKGPQADVGLGWWGKLYEENGRKILSDKSGDPYVHTNDWNTYEILALDGKVRTALNGHLCVDIDDPQIARTGIIGLQMHAGGPMEVRFKDLQLELNPKFEMTTAK